MTNSPIWYLRNNPLYMKWHNDYGNNNPAPTEPEQENN